MRQFFFELKDGNGAGSIYARDVDHAVERMAVQSRGFEWKLRAAVPIYNRYGQVTRHDPGRIVARSYVRVEQALAELRTSLS